MAVLMHMKIDSIPGESRKKGHEGQIEIDSWSFGMSQAASVSHGGGSSAGRVSFQDIHLSKRMCKADTVLMKHCANGTHIDKISIYCEKAGGDNVTVEYVRIDLTQVLVTSHQTSGADGSDQINTAVSLNFAKYLMVYTPQKTDGSPDGSVEQGYDIAENVGA
jgi:type VI secretion system secreted protein Hcp